MHRAAAALRMAALLCLIGVCAPFVATILVGETRGVGLGLILVLLIGWFVQGLVVFSAPLMLLTRSPALAGMGAHVGTGIAINLVIGLLLLGWNGARGTSATFSLPGTILFAIGGAAAGLFLYRRRAASPRML